MPFRISDVAMLQHDQGCQSLISLNLHGCEMISDTWISWPASWSKELKHLDLSNCNKTTNTGIRRMGKGKLLIHRDFFVSYGANSCRLPGVQVNGTFESKKSL